MRVDRGDDAVRDLLLDQEGGAVNPGVVRQEVLEDRRRDVVGEVADRAVDTLVVDKTGTLTEGKPRVVKTRAFRAFDEVAPGPEGVLRRETAE